MKKLFLVPLLMLTGCTILPHVPATDIAFNPKTQALKITSPKNVTITSVSIIQSNAFFSMQVNGYASTNDMTIVSAVSQAQSAVASNALVTINGLAGTITTAAIQGAK